MTVDYGEHRMVIEATATALFEATYDDRDTLWSTNHNTCPGSSVWSESGGQSRKRGAMNRTKPGRQHHRHHTQVVSGIRCGTLTGRSGEYGGSGSNPDRDAWVGSSVGRVSPHAKGRVSKRSRQYRDGGSTLACESPEKGNMTRVRVPPDPFHPVRGGQKPLDLVSRTWLPGSQPPPGLHTKDSVRGRDSPAAPHLQPHPDWSLSPTIDIPNPAAGATKPPRHTQEVTA